MPSSDVGLASILLFTYTGSLVRAIIGGFRLARIQIGYSRHYLNLATAGSGAAPSVHYTSEFLDPTCTQIHPVILSCVSPALPRRQVARCMVMYRTVPVMIDTGMCFVDDIG